MERKREGGREAWEVRGRNTLALTELDLVVQGNSWDSYECLHTSGACQLHIKAQMRALTHHIKG